MNTNKTTQHVKQLSEKAREGRRRRQRDRRRRQRQQEQCNNEYDYDDDYDADADYYLDIFDDYYRRSNIIVCDDKFNYLKKVDCSELHTKLAQIYSEGNNSSVLSNLIRYPLNKTFKKLDDFIAQTPPTENIRDFQISGIHLYEGKKLYNKMKDNPEQNCEIFGDNSGSYTCFYLYKSNDKNMYIIVTNSYSDKIATHYVKIENENIFG
jgi:hypothetical protein